MELTPFKNTMRLHNVKTRCLFKKNQNKTKTNLDKQSTSNKELEYQKQDLTPENQTSTEESTIKL